MRILLVVLIAATSVAAQTPDGAQLFQQHCSQCHNGSADPRTPGPETLKLSSPEAILVALVGPMRVPGAKLSGPERRAVAEFVTGKKIPKEASTLAQSAFKNGQRGGEGTQDRVN